MKKAYVKPTMAKEEIEVQSFVAASKECAYVPKNNFCLSSSTFSKNVTEVDITAFDGQDECLQDLKNAGMFSNGSTKIYVTETSGNRYKICKTRK